MIKYITTVASDIVAKLESLVGNDRLSAESLKGGTTIASTDKFVKTLSSTGILDPTLTSQDQTKEPTGFVNRTDSVLSFDNATRRFTITGVNFVVYSAGVKITKNTETLNPPIPNTTGLYWIYYAPTTYALTANISPPAFDSGAILIATVYWNATKGAGLPPDDERHLIVMDWNTHEYLHKTIGTRYESGLTGTFTDATMAVTGGTIWDEDIELTIPPVTQCIVLYRDGLEWEWTTLNNTVHYETGGNVQYDNAGAITPAGANDYVAYWVFATNNITYPIISIMGQRTDGTIANARLNNKYESLSFGDLPFVEYKLLYRVIVRNDATPYEETQDLRSVSNVPSGTYVATDHGVLTGLLDDDHTQYQLRSEFIDSTAGVADAAKPVETNASGLVDDTFLANSVLKSELINATTGATDAGKPIKTDAGGKLDNSFLATTPISDHGALTGLTDNDHPQYVLVEDVIWAGGRLTIDSTDPELLGGDALDSVFYMPYKNDLLTVYYDGNLITKKLGSGIEIVKTSFPNWTTEFNYDIFVYWNGSALALEAVKWTNTTARATAITVLKNYIHKSGDITKRYVGTVRGLGGISSPFFVDNTLQRYVWNLYNQVQKNMEAKDLARTTSYTYNSTTTREMNGSTANRLKFVSGGGYVNKTYILFGYTIRGFVDSNSAYVGVGRDSTTTFDEETITTIASTVLQENSSTGENVFSNQGYHYLTLLEKCVSTATLTMYADATTYGHQIWARFSC